MVGCIYKIIAKLMAKRLQKVISSLIGPLQSSYIQGRQILDGALIASEIIESCKRRNTEATLLKLDFHKAYDSVSWSFLQWIMDKMNFPPQWSQWIMTCVTTASASILVNGSPSEPFKLQRGLRQGDPLSPFLFVLIVEALNQIIIKATNMHLWKGIECCKNGLKISHLQFADDTLMFCDANIESLKNIQKALIIFHLLSGLQVNFHKSSLAGVNTSPPWLQLAAHSLRCKIGSIPFVYLGLPIGGSPLRIQAWDPIIDKFSRKLASWKGKLLSIGGRLTLIKASLSNLPLYFMSIFPMPKGVIEKINKIIRAFLWHGEAEKKGIPMVSWDVVQLPKSMGGLSIGNILHKNLALLFKWIWRYFNDPSPLWCKVIREKYKYSPSLTILDLNIPKSGGPWRLICAAILRHAEAKALAFHGVRKSIGNGSDSLFWHDIWICDSPLKVMFPRLFSIAINQNALVSSYGFWEGMNWIWSFSWHRELRPHDVMEKSRLDEVLQQAFLEQSAKDKLIWAYSSLGQFSAKSFTHELTKLKPPSHCDAVKGLWKGLVPHRIEVFVWLAILDKINTRHKLASIGILPMDQDICPLCFAHQESSDHLLLHCDIARQLWVWWLNIWDHQWVFPCTLKDAFTQWKCIKKKSVFFKKVWAASFFIIVWTTWKERNLRIFGNSTSTMKELKDMVLLRIGWWISGWEDEFPSHPLMCKEILNAWIGMAALGLVSSQSRNHHTFHGPHQA